ncbi:phage portal protein family protein [Methanococcoides sp. FTZ1]|uniref:phage portal protein family protein n=1 Tax=Methanococcoides sp. FTZ1 TaxID=3439061 RepID=UPI003F841E9A
MQLPQLFSTDRVKRKFRALAFAVGSPSYFNERQRDQELIRRYQTIFKQGGLITQAINCYPEYMFMNVLDNGFEFVGEDEKQIEFIEDLVTKINFLDASWQQVTNSLVEGSGLTQIVPTRAGGLYGLLPQDSALYDAEVKETGEISTYYKKSNKTWTKGTPVKVSDIWHLNLLPQTGSPWGQSLIGLAYDEILRDTKTAEGIANGIERHGTSKWDITVGDADQEVSDTDLKAVASSFENINSKSEFVHRPDIEIKELDKGGFPVAEYSETSIDRLCAALGVPNELLGQGRGSTEATANVRMKSFQNKIKSMQSRFNFQTYHQLFRPLLEKEFGTASPVYIKFGDIVPDDLDSKATALQKLMPALDPFLIYTRDEIRAKLGDGPYPEEDEE